MDAGVALSGVDYGGLFNQLIYWFGYGLLFIAMIGGIAAAYFFMSYKFKVTIFERGGDGSGSGHSIGRIRKDKIKEVKINGVRKWQMMMSRDVVDPKGLNCVYPNNNIFLYKSAPKTYHPFRLNVNNPSAVFEPIPTDVSFWQNLEMRQAAQDYNKPGFMDRYGNMLVMSGTVLFCLILVGVTVYYTYQHANGVTSALSSLTSAVKDINTIKGVKPF